MLKRKNALTLFKGLFLSPANSSPYPTIKMLPKVQFRFFSFSPSLLSKVPHSIKVTSVMEQLRKCEERCTKSNPKERKKKKENKKRKY